MAKFYISRPLAVDPVETGAKIHQIIKESDHTVAEVAEFLGVSEQAMYKWFKGKSVPTVDNLLTISYALHVSVYEMLECYGYAEFERQSGRSLEEDEMSSSFNFEEILIECA